MNICLCEHLCLCLCHDPNLGLATKARVHKSAGQERSPGGWESVRMNTHNLK
jgi:hypothetical protein